MSKPGTLIFSATDLANFLGCRHASFLDRRNIDDPGPIASRLGPFSYEPIDTKLSRSAKPKHVLQLCVYALLLAAGQGLMPPRIHIVLGDGSTVALPLSDFHYYFDIARERLEDFVEHLPAMSVGQPCNHCSLCRWRDRCDAEWEATDHLSLVANTRGQMAKLEAAGVTTMTALGAFAPGPRIADLQPDTLDRLRGQARLQVASGRTA